MIIPTMKKAIVGMRGLSIFFSMRSCCAGFGALKKKNPAATKRKIAITICAGSDDSRPCCPDELPRLRRNATYTTAKKIVVIVMMPTV